MRETEARLRSALASAVSALRGSRHLNVVELGAAGVTTFDVHRDETGTPRAATGLMLAWRELGTPPGRRRIVQAAGGVSDEAVVIVCSAPGEDLPDLAGSWLAETRPGSVLERVPGLKVAELLREVVADEPLQQPYGLIGLIPDPLGGEPRPAAVTVFPAGVARGATAELVGLRPRNRAFCAACEQPTQRHRLRKAGSVNQEVGTS
ncbi:hypothetical protein AB0C27_39635 [Nonomuraea sp. NPDC048882]|uniref:hypothetical protein n=1 Tax=Nonomuraea sp. NPDC048882 TaxID=3154347 RepID=UPI0033CC8160